MGDDFDGADEYSDSAQRSIVLALVAELEKAVQQEAFLTEKDNDALTTRLARVASVLRGKRATELKAVSHSGDWHPADVIAELKKRGQSLKTLAINNGYHATAAGKALKRPWPAMQHIIATALGVPPETIWPSRYVGGNHHVVRVMKRVAPLADP